MKKTIIMTATLFSLCITQPINACDEKKEVTQQEVKDTKQEVKVTKGALKSTTEESSEVKDIKKMVMSDPESVKKGEKTFNSLCVYCHGAGGSGGKAKKLVGRNLQVDYIFKTITNGKKRGSLNMPPWRKLAEEKRWTLVAYIRSLQKKPD